MIEGLKPYADYRDSGLGWLGRVPAHWTVRRAKFLLREVDSRSSTGKESLLRVSQYTGVTQRRSPSDSDAPATRAASLIGYKRVAPSDLVVNIMLAWNGSMGVSKHEGIASPAYGVYRFLGDAQPDYFHHLLRSRDYKARIKVASTGIVESRLRLYSDDLGRVEALLPPPDEQAAIVRFLDHANRKIDRFIRAKRKLIALLNEQKQAIIHRAVTQGIDPDESNMRSTFLWAADVPLHWSEVPLRHLLSFGPKNGISPPPATCGGVLSFSISAIRDGLVKIEGNEKYVQLDPSQVRRFAVNQGDILLVRGNGNVSMVAKCGMVLNVPPDCVYPDILIKLRTNELVSPEFMVLAMNSAYVGDQVSSKAKTTNGAYKVSGSILGALSILVPPIDEQQAIVFYLDQASRKLDETLARADREIALMQEYRTRLTADIVTGKLDVREAAAALPELDESPTDETIIDEPDDELELEATE